MTTVNSDYTPTEAYEEITYIRHMTTEEKDLLSETDTKLCNSGNTHTWNLEDGLTNFCSVFSEYQVKHIAIGGEHLLVQTEDLRLFTYGSNSHGQLGQGDCEEYKELCFVSSLKDKPICIISCGERHNAVVDNNGVLFTWGDSKHGQCGLGGKGIFTTPSKVCFPQTKRFSIKSKVPAEAFDTRIKAISCGELFSVAIDNKGCIWSWGMGCALGHGKDYDICTSPKFVKKLCEKKALMVACGAYHCFVVTQNDTIDSPFHVPVSPGYRSSSVASDYYSELKTLATSKVPFLQSTVTNVDANSVSSLKLSHSATELSTLEFNNTGCSSSSTADVRSLRKKCEKTLSLDETLIPSAASSQYYSAVDVEKKQVETSSETSSQCSIDANDETSSNESNQTVEADNLQAERSDDVQEKDLFDGKKPLFDDNTFFETALQRSSPSVRRAKPNLNSIISLDDSMSTGNFDSTNSTEVWSFGKNSYGQLGHGDLDDRYIPTLVKKLKGKGIVKVAAGSYHSLLLSTQGKVYSCGDNAFGQLGLMKSIIKIPKTVKVLENVRVWNFAAGRSFTVFLGDTERNKTDVYMCGDVRSAPDREVSDIVIEVSCMDRKRSPSKWKLFKRNSEVKMSQSLVDIQVRKLKHFDKKDFIRCVIAKDYSLASLTHTSSTGKCFEPIYKFARAERLMYQQLMTIQRYVIEPFVKTDAWSNITKMIGGEALLDLVDSFVDLLNATSTELIHLTDIVCLNLPVEDLFSYIFSDSFRAVYERYAKCYADASAVGYLQICVKPCSVIISKKRDLIKDLEKELSLIQATFESLLKVPLLHSHVYCDLAKTITSHYKGENESAHLKEVITRWSNFSEVNATRITMATATNKFWNESNQKLIEALKDPQRRVLKSSKNDPLSLARASRLSSHSYILCNDVFVHVQYNRNFKVFPLVTLWVDSELDTNYLHNAIKITSPEESFVLVAGTPDGKLAWLKELNQAIASCLASCSRLGLDNTSVNTSSGLLKAAVAREAMYTYINHLTYKGAVYHGMWMAGEPHGRGQMAWPDGACYEGELVKGRFEGYGQMRYVESPNNPVQMVYEGEWMEGKMNGTGKMKYGQNEEYVGHFKDGTRHGHGTLKSSGAKNSLDTVYVGNWENDIKSGYGVLDYIVRGEKYMGLWEQDQRQGFGVVVTVDGVYYEGRFYQNRLAGQGILLSEDDTCYEGEFTADMLLSGKGILTLPNGDFIDGSFYGSWGESIKVSGTFSKYTNPLRSSSNILNGEQDRLKTTDFTIDANVKWKSLFDECLNELGCESDISEVDTKAAWRNVNNIILKAAGSLSGMYRHPTARMDIDYTRKVEFTEYMKLATDLKGLQEFLEEAFKTHGHPLYTLVEGLSEVYRATYVGVGAHRRLLPHAVAEAKSYVSRLFNVLRVLFPGLHDEEFVMLSNDTADGYLDPPVNSVSLLHPLLLPRLYPPLFTLYALQTEKTDALYTEKLHYLNKRGDMALLSFLGVKRDFWLLPTEMISSDEEKSHKVYIEPIETLEQICTTYSPMGKIDVLRKTFAKINQEVDSHFKGVRKVLAMDDLFPLFQFIVIRARIPHLGSEIQFIEDLVEESVMVGEAGHMLTTLSACYFQIQQERDRDM